MAKTTREMAAKAVRKLAKYVPHAAPDFADGTALSHWCDELEGTDWEALCNLFGRLKYRKFFPGLGEVLGMINREVPESAAVDAIALQIYRRMSDGSILSQAAAQVWGMAGGETGFTGIRTDQDGAVKMIRSIVLAIVSTNHIPLKAENLAVVEREALPSSNESSDQASESRRDDFIPMTKEQMNELKRAIRMKALEARAS